MRETIGIERNKIFKSKGGFVLIVSSLCLLALSLALFFSQTVTGAYQMREYIGVYYSIYSQFSSLIFITVLSLISFSNDYEEKNIVFYIQNNLTLYRLYIYRSLLYIIIFSIITLLPFIIVLGFFRTPITAQEFIVISLMLLINLYNITLGQLFSLVNKNVTRTMMSGLIFWIAANVGGFLAMKSTLLKGAVSLIDGNSYYAMLLKSYTAGNSLTSRNLLIAFLIAFVWVLIFYLTATFYIITRRFEKNAI